MDTIEKLAIGLVGFIITSIIAYLFKMRQLYIVVPKLYRHAVLSEKGSICEAIIFNRSLQVEDEIKVEIDPTLKCELIAASQSGVEMQGSTIKVDRLHKSSEVSIMILVDNGVLDFEKITVSSKSLKGKSFKLITNVPPNAAKSLISILCMTLPLIGLYYAPRVYNYAQSEWAKKQLSSTSKLGWEGLENYASTDLRKSYTDGEFPFVLKGIKYEKERIALTYQIYNKSALPLKVYAEDPSEDKIPPGGGKLYFTFADVDPMSEGILVAHAPLYRIQEKSAPVDFSFKSGTEFSYKIRHNVIIDPPR